jgi:hypothetical protein
MAHLQLRPNVSFALVDDRPLFLDLRRDRYFALDGSAASAFEALRSNPRHMPDSRTAALLLSTGLFIDAPDPAELSPVTITAAERELPVRAIPSLAPMDVIEIGLLLWQSRRALRTKRLEKLIERCRRTSRPHCPPASADRIIALANRFRGMRGWISIKPSCLQDSLALHRWLARRRASADLVIGVKLDPFAAHCWVQSDGIVLNDAPDTVRAFTPILTLQCS